MTLVFPQYTSLSGDYLNPPEPLQPEALPVAVESFVHILKAAVAGTPSRATSRWHKAPLTSVGTYRLFNASTSLTWFIGNA